VLLASRVRAWRQAVPIVQPATLLRWHRRLFRGYWRRKSRAATPAHRPPRAPETITPSEELAATKRLWGAERIRGAPLKRGSRVAESAIQRHPREARPPRRAGQPWATFLRNQALVVQVGDFPPVTDPRFRPVHVFCVVTLETRRVAHVGVPRHPTDAWVARRLREAPPFGERPIHLIRDNDSTYGRVLARVAAARGITKLRTA